MLSTWLSEAVLLRVSCLCSRLYSGSCDCQAMRRFPMKTRAVIFMPLLLCLLVLLESQTTGQKTKSAEFRTGQLVKIEDVTDFMKHSEKAGYLLTIQDGAEQYFAHYTMTYFGHDRSK